MENEIWKKVKGFEGCYEVSNFGKVKSLHSNKILKPRRSRRSDVYTCLAVALYKRGKRTDELISRLVATAFCPNPKYKKFVNHIDFNPENNNASNLEWVTAKENYLHSQKAGRMDNKNNFKNRMLSNTDPVKIEVIKYLIEKGFNFKKISLLFECDVQSIRYINYKYISINK